MKLLCVDTFGECALGWLMQCQDAGHQVRWYIAEAKNRHIGDGIIRKVDDWHDHMGWADIVFTPDNLKFLKELDAWRKRDAHKIILAPSQEVASWETDRLKGMAVMRKAGIEIPDCKEFSDYDQAIKHVTKEMRPFVSKPCGDETDKSLSYVGKTPKDLIFKLSKWKQQQKLKGKFLLQEKIKGVEAAVGSWFGPAGFTGGWEENFEFKKIMAGDLGVNCGEAGTVMRYVAKSKLADMVLKPIEDELHRLDYVGNIDVNCIIDEDGKPWPLEFTCRPGWPAFNIQAALLEGDPLEWLADLWEGKKLDCFRLNEVAVGFVLAIGDFPHSHMTQKEVVGYPIWGLDDNRSAHIMLCQAMRGIAPHEVGDGIIHGPALVTAGDYVAVVTGTAGTVHDARRKAQTALGKIEIPCSPFWRDDIGEKLQRQLPEIQSHGYMSGMEY
jgi:phosphoribosylamine--glycine ligase